jgi:hypothetical protein
VQRIKLSLFGNAGSFNRLTNEASFAKILYIMINIFPKRTSCHPTQGSYLCPYGQQWAVLSLHFNSKNVHPKSVIFFSGCPNQEI